MSAEKTPEAIRQSWNERYSAEGYVFGTEPNDFLVEVADRIPSGPVLCIAEGEGRNAVYLAGRGHAVTAVDQSGAGLAKAQRLAGARGVEIETVVGDLADYEIQPRSWAGIVSIFLHIPAELRRIVYARAAAGLQPGGVFVLEAYHPRQFGLGTGGPRDPNLMPTLQLLRQELAGLDLEIGRELRREVIEGTGHTGMAEVVQVLGRKPTVSGD